MGTGTLTIPETVINRSNGQIPNPETQFTYIVYNVDLQRHICPMEVDEQLHNDRGDVTSSTRCFKPYTAPMYRSDDECIERRFPPPEGSQGSILTKSQGHSTDVHRGNKKLDDLSIKMYFKP